MTVIKGFSTNVLLVGALVAMTGHFCRAQTVTSQRSEIKFIRHCPHCPIIAVLNTARKGELPRYS